MARIMLVDQSPPERALVRMTLTVSGHQVVEAASAQQAVDLFTQTPFDLVVLDMQLPDAPGDEAVQRLRAVPGRAETPIIAVIEDETDEDVSRAMMAGAIDRVVKPFAAHELKEAVDRALTMPVAVKKVVLDQHTDLYTDVARMQEEARSTT